MSPPLSGSLSEDEKRGEVLDAETKQLKEKYSRGEKTQLKKIRDRKLKRQLGHKEKQIEKASLASALAEKWLLPGSSGFVEAEGVERTQHFSQSAMAAEVPLAAAQTAFDLRLTELGPYNLAYSRNGRSLLLAGRKGHVAMLDWRHCHIVVEMQLKETLHDVCFLHNELFFAAAQKKYVFLYDKRGLELHRLKDHTEPLRLHFLPQHFLLASVGKTGVLNYIDTSMGAPVAQMRTKKGRCGAMALNGNNGVIGLGHANGTATLWSPNLQSPLATWLAHRGPLTAVEFDRSGHYAATAGMDSVVKIFDLRKFQEVHTFFSPSVPSSLSFSQRGLLAVSYGSGVEIWKDAATKKEQHPYLKHRVPHGWAVEGLSFCPYEDALGVGHVGGFTSMLVPGAGEPNFDSLVANPFETAQQRREGEIHSLLDKLPPESIALDPDRVGSVQKGIGAVQAEMARKERAANLAAAGKPPPKEKNRAKGRNKSSKRAKRKLLNVIDEKRQRVLHQKEQAKAKAGQGDAKEGGGGGEGALPAALARFKTART